MEKPCSTGHMKATWESLFVDKLDKHPQGQPRKVASRVRPDSVMASVALTTLCECPHHSRPTLCDP